MAIRLNVEPYCEDCPKFNAVTHTSIHSSHYDTNEFKAIIHEVTCEYSELCKYLHNHIMETTMKGEEIKCRQNMTNI